MYQFIDFSLQCSIAHTIFLLQKYCNMKICQAKLQYNKHIFTFFVSVILIFLHPKLKQKNTKIKNFAGFWSF